MRRPGTILTKRVNGSATAAAARPAMVERITFDGRPIRTRPWSTVATSDSTMMNAMNKYQQVAMK